MVVGECQNLSKLQIASAAGEYEIVFEPFKDNLNPNHFYIVDSFFKDSFSFSKLQVIYFDANEDNKSLSSAEKILISLSEMGMTKRDTMVVVGGGCVQDIGTLVASLYMRGVKWIFVPTTLAAMGDSCIGGKSSINAGSVKNLVGNFYPPSKVIIDASFCASLPTLEMIAGLSEIIKICFARSLDHFSESIKMVTQIGLQQMPEKLNDLIFLSLTSKKYFINSPLFDCPYRYIPLNPSNIYKS
jgi:3-dehydroquinate synthase